MATLPNNPYPGVYLQEVSSGTQTITGASTSVAAFVGYVPVVADGGETKEDKYDKPIRVFSFAEFSRKFGGLDAHSETSYAVQQFFLNGGSEAWIVAVNPADPEGTASITFPAASDADAQALTLTAAQQGEWGEGLSAAVYLNQNEAGDAVESFDLVVRHSDGEDEVYQELSDVQAVEDIADSSEFLGEAKLETDQEDNVLWPQPGPAEPADPENPVAGSSDHPDSADFRESEVPLELAIPDDQNWASTRSTFVSNMTDEANRKGIYALADIEPDTFNILCLPDAIHLTDPGADDASESEGASGTGDSSGTDASSETEDSSETEGSHAQAKTLYEAAAKFCEDRDAFLIIDLPTDIDTPKKARDWFNNGGGPREKNTATYFPHLNMPDPLADYDPRQVGASGTMAGIYARTDAQRGIWKAPAGTDAVVRGANPSQVVGDDRNGVLNSDGINVIRAFSGYGTVSWGARTLVGNKENDNKYVPVRRMTLFLKKSLELGLKWAVFEPNAEPLWASIRQTVEAFLNRLYRQGAFKGTTPRDAYFVMCDSSTTTADDINRGIVNVVVGFAPLKPAEFVVVELKQKAGQAQS